jgi:hypothetical protein
LAAAGTGDTWKRAGDAARAAASAGRNEASQHAAPRLRDAKAMVGGRWTRLAAADAAPVSGRAADDAAPVMAARASAAASCGPHATYGKTVSELLARARVAISWFSKASYAARCASVACSPELLRRASPGAAGELAKSVGSK